MQASSTLHPPPSILHNLLHSPSHLPPSTFRSPPSHLNCNAALQTRFFSSHPSPSLPQLLPAAVALDRSIQQAQQQQQQQQQQCCRQVALIITGSGPGKEQFCAAAAAAALVNVSIHLVWLPDEVGAASHGL